MAQEKIAENLPAMKSPTIAESPSIVDEIKQILLPPLKATFIEKEFTKLRSALYEIFSKSQDPYKMALDLTEKASDYLQPRSNSLSATIFRNFSVWHKEHWQHEPSKKKLLSLAIRKRAYDVCSRRHTHLLADGANIFNLVDIGEIFISDIKNKVASGFYKEAVNCVIALKLQCYFGLNEVLMPCVLQDKTNFVEPYLDGFPDLQREFLQMLDQLCTSDADIDGFLSTKKIAGVRRDKMVLKPMQKLIARVSKRFDAPIELTPNFTRTRSEGTMRYLLVRRYIEKSIDQENFDDMVYHSVTTCPHLGVYLLDLLCLLHNDLPEALKWAYRLHVDDEKWPSRLAAYAKTNPRILVSRLQCEDEEDSSDEYLKFPLSSEFIYMVDNENQLEKALEKILTADILGLDTEFQPNFGQPIEKVAILQIALMDCVFLLDFVTLLTNTAEEKLKNAMERIFNDEKILKLGFQFTGDVRTLVLTMPFCKEIFSSMKNMLCVGMLVDQLRRHNLGFMRSATVCDTAPSSDVANGPVELSDDGPDVAQTTVASNGKKVALANCKAAITPAKDDAEILGKAIAKKEAELSLTCNVDDGITVANDGSTVATPSRAIDEQWSTTQAGTDDSMTSLAQKKAHSGLSEVCAFFLSKPLCKNEQISNWCRRPLRKNQMLYAALDAYCLLFIYGKIRQHACELGMDFDKALKASLISGANEVEARFKVKKDRSYKNMNRDDLWKLIQDIDEERPVMGNGRVKSVHDVKVVADSMLSGLGKQLRRCGIDCKLMEGCLVESIATISLKENRLIISSGCAFEAAAKCVPPHQCCCIPNTLSSKDQLALFIRLQNLQIMEDDIFSRCVHCNGANFLVIPSPIFQTLWDNKMAPNNFLDPVPFDREVAVSRIISSIEDCQRLSMARTPEFCPETWTYTIDRFSINLLNGKISDLSISTDHQPGRNIVIKKVVLAQIEAMPNSSIFDAIRWFYVCAGCGKIYWDGAHMKRYVENIGVDLGPSEKHRFLR